MTIPQEAIEALKVHVELCQNVVKELAGGASLLDSSVYDSLIDSFKAVREAVSEITVE